MTVLWPPEHIARSADRHSLRLIVEIHETLLQQGQLIGLCSLLFREMYPLPRRVWALRHPYVCLTQGIATFLETSVFFAVALRFGQ
jgi:hypothetical protein